MYVHVLSIQLFKPHYTHACPTIATVVPLHVATAKDHGNFEFVCHDDKPAFFLLHLTTPPCKCGNQFNCKSNPQLQIP